MFFRFGFVGFGCLISSVAFVGLLQASQQRPVFRSGVELVQIDVVVVDEHGQPVRGLTKEDFQLYDRGVEQAIATFAARIHDPAPAGLFPAGLPADVADNRSAKSDRLVIIVLDDLHFRGRTPEATALVRRVVNEIGDSVSMGLVTTSGTFGVEVTEDRARLLRAVDGFLDRFDPGRGAHPAAVPVRQGGSADLATPRPNDIADFWGTLHAYKTVEDVARMAGANDGRRKAFIWISAGVDGALRYHDACERTGGNDYISTSLCGMFDKLHRSSVAVYPISPGGPMDTGGPLVNIATDTGGFAIPASNMNAGLTRVLSDLDNYYLLGFYPSEEGRKGYRDVDVRVLRPGLTVRHRLGYHAAGPPPPPKNDDPLGALVAPIVPTTDLHLRLGATTFFRKNGSPELLATIEVDPGTNGMLRGQLEFAVFAVNLKKKKVTQSTERRVVIERPAEGVGAVGAGLAPARILLQAALPCPPGAYQLRASVMAKAVGKSGSVYLQTDVPSVEQLPIGLSGIALAAEPADASKLVEPTPLADVPLPFAPAVEREFRQHDTLLVFFQLFRRKSRVPVDGSAALVDDEGREAARIPWSVAASSGGLVTLRLPLRDVPAGAYRLVVLGASNGAAPSVTQIGLRIVP